MEGTIINVSNVYFAFPAGVEPMGLFFSMRQAPGQAPGRRLMKKNVTAPVKCHLAVLRNWISEAEIWDAGNDVICRVACERYYMGPGVKRIDIREGRLCGTLFIPSGKLSDMGSHRSCVSNGNLLTGLNMVILIPVK